MMATTRASRLSTSRAIARFNAWFFDVFDGLIDWSIRRVKRQVFFDLPGTIVEIGPGVGANFRYYRPGTRVVAIEPNLAMHERLEANARAAGIWLELKDTFAEDTGLPGESSDVVVSSLVLCTVADPNAAASEILRILRPGGRFLFVEHVRGQGPALRALQRLIRSPWRWLFEGCHLMRDLRSDLEGTGFSDLDLTERTVLTPFLPVNSFVYGTATK